MKKDPDSETPVAVVLLSGGLDSTTVLAHATKEGYRCHCLSFSYGQRHTHELELARQNAVRWGAIRHLVLNIQLDAIGGSALTSSQFAVPKDSATEVSSLHSSPGEQIPITYVPGRNTIFLAYAASWAEVLGARDIFIGVNAVDFSGYPDCRPDYLAAMQAALILGTKAGREGHPLRLQAPLLNLSKGEIIAKGLVLGVDYAQTHSCYDPDSRHRACGHCDACVLRLQGFADAKESDPAPYQKI